MLRFVTRPEWRIKRGPGRIVVVVVRSALQLPERKRKREQEGPQMLFPHENRLPKAVRLSTRASMFALLAT